MREGPVNTSAASAPSIWMEELILADVVQVCGVQTGIAAILRGPYSVKPRVTGHFRQAVTAVCLSWILSRTRPARNGPCTARLSVRVVFLILCDSGLHHVQFVCLGEQTAVELQDWLLLRGGGWPVLVIALIAEDIWVVQAMLLINGVNGINLTPLAALRVDLSTVVTLLAGLAGFAELKAPCRSDPAVGGSVSEVFLLTCAAFASPPDQSNLTYRSGQVRLQAGSAGSS